ncbi:MAG: guanylate kinase [Candidatus Taylorbacteria bacterium]|nr:guanylate kinase [Candidatus Taylorbacteria bacterium]
MSTISKPPVIVTSLNPDLKAALAAATNGPVVVIVSGPSGAGKTVLIDAVLQSYGEYFGRVTTCTTRPPRKKEDDTMEVDGADYYFLSKEQFLEKRRQGLFLEHAQVHGGHFYGTYKTEIERVLGQGKHVLLNIDVNGSMQVLGASLNDIVLAKSLVRIFLAPLKQSELVRRINKRKANSPEELADRVAKARLEFLDSEIASSHFISSTTHEHDVLMVECIILTKLMERSRAPEDVLES